MIKKYLLPLFILLAGCSDPLDEFILSSGATICNHIIVLGDTLTVDDSMTAIEFHPDTQSYSISCDQTGAFVLGSGTPSRQFISIDKLVFSTNAESRIDSVAGRWRILRPSGAQVLDSLKASPDSSAFADSIQYLQQTHELSNDIRQIQFNIQQTFDEPTSSEPVSWSTVNGVISFNTSVDSLEVLFFVSTEIQE